MVRALGVLIMAVLLFSACDMKFKPFEDDENEHRIEVCRYDRLESLAADEHGLSYRDAHVA